MNIVGVSEEGLQVICNLTLEPNLKLKIESEIFEEIGIQTPVVRVAHCERLEKQTTSYSIKVNFIGLTPGDLQQVRLYANKARLLPDLNLRKSRPSYRRRHRIL